ATQGDQQQAVKMLLQALEIRRRDGILYQTLRYEALVDMRIIGHDHLQRPVIYFCAASQSDGLASIRDQIIVIFEGACRLSSEQSDGQVVLVVDMHGFHPRLNADFSSLKDLAETLGCVFAERIRRIVIVDFSRAATTVWWIIKPLLSHVTQNKFAFLGLKDAREFCATELAEVTADQVIHSFEVSYFSDDIFASALAYAMACKTGEFPPRDGHGFFEILGNCEHGRFPQVAGLLLSNLEMGDPLVDAKRGDRIFQEGTKVGDEYCILSIYDDPGSAILNCTAYDPMQAETLNCAISYAELEGLMSADKATIICDQVADHRCAWLSTHLELVHTEESRSLRVTAHPKPCVQAQAPMRTRAELQELEERRNEQIAAKKDAATRALLAGLARTKHAK
ncbi:unnamed protein product, partial [Polarella glacialis]